MEERQSEAPPSRILELIRRNKCDQKTCPNFDHSYLVMLGQKHFTLTANDFSKWDKAIESGKATIETPPLDVRGSPAVSRKSQAAQMNQNSAVFNGGFPNAPYPFMSGFPMAGYPSYSMPPQYPMPFMHPAPSIPPAPVTPVRQAQQLLFSSPIDSSSDLNKNVAGFMDTMIAAAGTDQEEVDGLIKLKAEFLVSKPDMLVLKNMDVKDHQALGISWGLGKRLSREAAAFLKKNK
jgi:hypothetical protein